MAYIAGIDGCRKGWIIAIQKTDTGQYHYEVVETFPQILESTRGFKVVGLDMPIGLLDRAVRGGRTCDTMARRLLKSPRASSVFSAPSRPALEARTYKEASASNREHSPDNLGLSKQSFAIMPKIREVDECMTPRLQKVVKEVHPELCFYAMNNNSPVNARKKRTAGILERLQLLQKHFCGFEMDPKLNRKEVMPDDFLDAFAALWTARRIHAGAADRIPDTNELDSHGLLMEIWR